MGGCVSQSAWALCSPLSRCALLPAEWKHHASVGRCEDQPCFSEPRPEQSETGRGREREQNERRHKLGVDYPEGKVPRGHTHTFLGIVFHPFCPLVLTILRLGYAMLAQRNGLPPGCKPVPLKDHPDLRDVDVNAEGCCSLSPSPSSGGCPWARLAGVDGCLSEPYCLWFQLLARAYWGEVELGLTSPNRSVSWARLREASRKNCVRSRVRMRESNIPAS